MGEYMLVNIKLNGKSVVSDIAADMTLYDFVRKHGCYSVKCGCETSNCGLCTARKYLRRFIYRSPQESLLI